MPGLTRGLIQIYTGEGKGKTTAALGLALRATGHGLRVFIVQFMKGQGGSGELKALKRLEPECQIEYFGAPAWAHKGQDLALHRQEALRAFQLAKEIIDSGNWDMVILDEIFNALWYELIPENEVLALLEQKPAQVELILTGRHAALPFLDKADLVTEMKLGKHPFSQGVPARPGIEY